MDCCAASRTKHARSRNDSIEERHDLHVFYRESTPTLIRFIYLRESNANKQIFARKLVNFPARNDQNTLNVSTNWFGAIKYF